MNKIFSPNGMGWPSFPKRSYGKLDQIEPLNAGVSERAGTFSLDVVDAGWSEFAIGGSFDLSNPTLLQSVVSDYWAFLFRRGPPQTDPYDSAPVYRIEITSSPGDAWYKELVNLSEEEWVLIELEGDGRHDADVFGALLQAIPVPARLKRITRAIPQTSALNVIFSPDTWPNAETADIQDALSKTPALEYLVGLDVGQGAAIGLADANEDIHMYFDLGGGVYRNAPTRPNPLRFCWRMNSPIVLSHWDADHWSGESSDPHALPRTWIAPRQNMTTTHILFVNRMLKAGGTLLMWGAAAPSTISVTIAGSHTLELRRCTGPTNKRNGSGIAAVVEHFATRNQWLLTGDAGYHEIGTHPSSPVAIVVPHHGADMGTSSVPPGKPASYTRLFYSFGPGNRHGRHPGVQHPTSAAMAAHSYWNHGSWTAASPGNSVAGGEILASASHPGSHLNGVVMGWSSAPPVPLSSFPCTTPGGCTCTVTMTQS